MLVCSGQKKQMGKTTVLTRLIICHAVSNITLTLEISRSEIEQTGHGGLKLWTGLRYASATRELLSSRGPAGLPFDDLWGL